MLYYCSRVTGNIPFSNGYFKVFFDTDNSEASGYTTGVSGGKIGSELLLEGSNFYDQRSGGYNDGSVAGVGFSKEISADGLSVEMRIDRQLKYNDNEAVFSSDVESVTLLVNIGDTSWNLVEFSPKTLHGYVYSIRSQVDVILRHNQDMGADLRLWRAENGLITLSGSVDIPSAFAVTSSSGAAEHVTAGLWFPDPASELGNNTRLNIQLGEWKLRI